jgi:hypothetical protein
MGERLDLSAPHRGERWWRHVAETVAAPKAAWRLCPARNAGDAESS